MRLGREQITCANFRGGNRSAGASEQSLGLDLVNSGVGAAFLSSLQPPFQSTLLLFLQSRVWRTVSIESRLERSLKRKLRRISMVTKSHSSQSHLDHLLRGIVTENYVMLTWVGKRAVQTSDDSVFKPLVF